MCPYKKPGLKVIIFNFVGSNSSFLGNKDIIKNESRVGISLVDIAKPNQSLKNTSKFS